MGKKIVTTEDFIRRAKVINGEKYSYDSAEVVLGNKYVVIGCPLHGEFSQRWNNHLNGSGCPKCSGLWKRKITPDNFESISRGFHGDKYDYSLVSYFKLSDRVDIICKKHGIFSQIADSHVRGRGCRKCSYEDKRLKHSEFKSRAAKIHNNKYDYSLVEYKTIGKSVTIICPIHGSFDQQPNNHLNGQGCTRCTGRAKHTNETFVELAVSVHKDTYDYSEVEYKTNKELVSIICKEHGIFQQAPSDHFKGSGCPNCNWDKNQPTHIYVIEGKDCMKVGISLNLRRRVSELRKDTPFIIEPLSSFVVKDYDTARQIEKLVHTELGQYNKQYSDFSGATEWFGVSQHYAEKVIESLLLQEDVSYSKNKNIRGI